ncbi:hypothetical protein NECAME_03189 [Necator americanus]|uniref:Uncharacterized protein n=1 Tax=Necator americanus TaxID=51031 RepID=W2T689_NECAM|nr:hypothetical protein NECAME_03189 [Necator americanus]ETN77525.1 hypothetical protein NECAME_03189 [Necator americanus]
MINQHASVHTLTIDDIETGHQLRLTVDARSIAFDGDTYKAQVSPPILAKAAAIFKQVQAEEFAQKMCAL